MACFLYIPTVSRMQGVPGTCHLTQDAHLMPAPGHLLQQRWPQQAFHRHSGSFPLSQKQMERWGGKRSPALAPELKAPGWEEAGAHFGTSWHGFRALRTAPQRLVLPLL